MKSSTYSILLRCKIKRKTLRQMEGKVTTDLFCRRNNPVVIDTYTSHKEMEEVDETLIDNFINRMDDINKFPFFYLLTRKINKKKTPI
jgi:hypothetical protein